MHRIAAAGPLWFCRIDSGFPNAVLPPGRPEPQHRPPAHGVSSDRGADAAPADPRTGPAPCALGPAACLPRAAACGLGRQSQAGTKDLALGGAPAAPAALAQVHRDIAALAPPSGRGRPPAADRFPPCDREPAP